MLWLRFRLCQFSFQLTNHFLGQAKMIIWTSERLIKFWCIAYSQLDLPWHIFTTFVANSNWNWHSVALKGRRNWNNIWMSNLMDKKYIIFTVTVISSGETISCKHLAIRKCVYKCYSYVHNSTHSGLITNTANN